MKARYDCYVAQSFKQDGSLLKIIDVFESERDAIRSCEDEKSKNEAKGVFGNTYKCEKFWLHQSD